MAKKRSTRNGAREQRPARFAKKPIEQYEHPDKKRLNNPPVGLVTPATDPIECVNETTRPCSSTTHVWVVCGVGVGGVKPPNALHMTSLSATT